MNFFHHCYKNCNGTYLWTNVIKTLQRELRFDYDTNLARLRCLPLQSNIVYTRSCASSVNQSNIANFFETHFSADFRNLKSLAKIIFHPVKLNCIYMLLLFENLHLDTSKKKKKKLSPRSQEKLFTLHVGRNLRWMPVWSNLWPDPPSNLIRVLLTALTHPWWSE